MNVLPDDVPDAPTLEIAAERLGAHLGLGAPAPLPATSRALRDAHYAKALTATAKLPELLARLIAAAATPPPSSAMVAAKAAGSALRWGMQGLEHAKPWDIARRLEACGVCPFQARAPDTLVYRGAAVVVGKDARICTACNCLTNTKAAMASEHCPERSPEDPEMSRWGERWTPREASARWPWR